MKFVGQSNYSRDETKTHRELKVQNQTDELSNANLQLRDQWQ